MSNKVRTLSESNVKFLCGLIRDVATIDSAISDLEIASDKVFSSKKVTELARETKHSLEQYIQSSINGLTHLKKKIVDTLPSDADAEENILYLVKDTSVVDDVVYNQYLLIDGKLEPLGSTNTDLSNYFNKDEISERFALISNLQTLIDMVGNTSDLETTAKDTLVSAINEIKEGLDNIDIDNYIKKDAIVTTLDSTVTNEQVVGAKVVYDGLESKIDADKIATTINDACTNEQISSAKAVNDLVLGLFTSNFFYKNTAFLKNTFGNDSNSFVFYTDANELPVGLQSASDLLNAPTSGYVYYLTLFFNGDSRFRVQLGIPIMSYDIFIRYMGGSAWSEWKKLALATG